MTPLDHSSSSTEPVGHRAPADIDLKVTLCIINHDGVRYLEDSVSAALAQDPPVAEILVIDDASKDRSVGFLRDRFPRVRVVPLVENRGPAGARNVALEEAKTDLVLFVDNDVNLAPDCAARLLEALSRTSDAAIAVPRVLYAHRPQFIQFDGADSHFIGLQIVEGDSPLSESSNHVRSIGSLISACFLIARSRLSEEVFFDESFFIYLEDHDFGVRVRGQGRRILSVPTALCHHGEGTADLSIRALGGYTEMRVFYLVRNRWQFILKNYSIRSLILLAPALTVYELAQTVIIMKKGWWSPWAAAITWMIGNRRQILTKRRLARSSRTVGDRVLLRGGPIPFREELTVSPLERTMKRLLDRCVALNWAGVIRIL